MVQYLYNPKGVFHREERSIAPRLDSLNDKVLGLVDNGKVNADRFLQAIQHLLEQRFRIRKVLKVRKARVGTPALFTPEFVEQCDFAVNAFGD
ncbi:MAG: hypothetical protein JRH18_02405 [Deltaproteobacteria bacterium]|nr:hypothetical protein [Deltaproteobacteria bacterium]MBW2150500.1 hypothetical protein [Deltaproteobacteria bacterium]